MPTLGELEALRAVLRANAGTQLALDECARRHRGLVEYVDAIRDPK